MSSTNGRVALETRTNKTVMDVDAGVISPAIQRSPNMTPRLAVCISLWPLAVAVRSYP